METSSQQTSVPKDKGTILILEMPEYIARRLLELGPGVVHIPENIKPTVYALLKQNEKLERRIQELEEQLQEQGNTSD